MRDLFYSLFGIFGFLGLYFVLSSIFGSYHLGSLHPALSKLVLILGSIAGIRLLYWAYELGELQQRFGAACGAVLAAVVTFQLIQVAAMLGFEVFKKLAKA
jgi:hypothetical protein